MAAVIVIALTGAVLTKTARDTMGDPLVRAHPMSLPGLSPASGPTRVLLMSDIHVAGPDMTPERLTRIVARMNALHPDIVMIAGDFISDKLLATRHYSLDEAIAPLAGLRPRLGTVAVLGNHDYLPDTKAARTALEARGIRVLHNDAARIGPITVGGMGDASYHDADMPKTTRAMHELGPPYIMLAHEPDTFNNLPSDIPLMLAGHTHCGQIAPPPIGPIVTWSSFGRRYACGLVREHGTALIVTAGLGTSDLPIRFGAHGDVWLLTMMPAPIPPIP